MATYVRYLDVTEILSCFNEDCLCSQIDNELRKHCPDNCADGGKVIARDVRSAFKYGELQNGKFMSQRVLNELRSAIANLLRFLVKLKVSVEKSHCFLEVNFEIDTKKETAQFIIVAYLVE